MREFTFNIGDYVVLSIDPEKKKRLITAIYLDIRGPQFFCHDGSSGGYHYEEYLRPYEKED